MVQAGGRVSDRVATAILDQIASGHLTPGQRLPGERQLAEDLGVSRVSVRAALQGLKAKGFLESIQGGGTMVISSAEDMDSAMTQMLRTNRKNLHDLAEIRAGLEVWAARRAALNAEPRDIEDLGRAVKALGKAKGRARVEEDVNFHLALARATHSAIYMHIFDVIRDTIRDTLEYHKYRLFSESVDDETLLDQHRAVYEAIRDKAPERAARAMEGHLEWVLERYEAERRRQADITAALAVRAEG
ncbi:MAG: FadR family transcriptional regulator [Rhodospirillales bacterium]|nr:FadR family transcriptional regulator [Rhodospirillales bacterium]MCW8861891.1 FadR family transcriptional regulator [Rhodospirillales bacterium]MCW8952486.1 FadR family transcriptional regulator [Rhodospirillales bacterium]MCW8969728.1 FadR family transcriptional regulator [Rhodospirillales bacterium]MCW9003367.1 FadR family transcriptional regulator [Rhodospirillales bacterium]